MRKFVFIVAAFLMLSASGTSQTIESVNVATSPDGPFSLTKNNGSRPVIVGTVAEGKKDGQWIEYFEGDNFLPNRIVHYEKGKKNGLYIEIDKTGALVRKAEYKDNVLHGEECAWYRGGRLSKMNTYKNGQMHGNQVLCYERGGNQEVANYKEGRRDGLTTWYDENGNKLMTINYKDGRFEGKQETFYPNGNLKTSKEYRNNVQTGEMREYYESGALRLVTNFKNGAPQGKAKTYEDTQADSPKP